MYYGLKVQHCDCSGRF